MRIAKMIAGALLAATAMAGVAPVAASAEDARGWRSEAPGDRGGDRQRHGAEQRGQRDAGTPRDRGGDRNRGGDAARVQPSRGPAQGAQIAPRGDAPRGDRGGQGWRNDGARADRNAGSNRTFENRQFPRSVRDPGPRIPDRQARIGNDRGDRRADGPRYANGHDVRANDRRDDDRRDDRRNDAWRGRDDRRDNDRGRYAGGYGGGGDYRWRGGNGDWDRRWREDRRYDWRDYRGSNRQRYALPRYYGARGAYYRRWSPGYRLDPWAYGQSYWISDPYQYRLPPAYGYYRWVRYYNDVMLVDTRSGLISDVEFNFFF